MNLRRHSGSSPELVASFASLATYRKPVISLLMAHFGSRLAVYAGGSAADIEIPLLRPIDLPIRPLRNVFLPRSLLVQNIPVRTYLSCDVLMLDLNPRVVHAWPLLILRRLLRRRTILWGHAWPRAGRESRSETVRCAMRSLATGLVAYTESQASELRAKHRHIPVFAAPNALVPQQSCRFDGDSIRDSVLCVGRLTASKKPLLLMDAFEVFAAQEAHTRLVIVGDGPELDAVRDRAGTSRFKHRIEVVGRVDDVESLRARYAQAIVSVSPGYVGLSATQTFSFGVPMIVSRDEPHAPEIEAVNEGVNGVFFTTNVVADLAEALRDVVSNAAHWRAAGPAISASCAASYSTEIMASGLIKALEHGRR